MNDNHVYGVLFEGVFVGTISAPDEDTAIDLAACRYNWGGDESIQVFDPEDET
jgi:hypothetical protein